MRNTLRGAAVIGLVFAAILAAFVVPKAGACTISMRCLNGEEISCETWGTCDPEICLSNPWIWILCECNGEHNYYRCPPEN